MKRLLLPLLIGLCALPRAQAGRFAGAEPFDFLFMDAGALQTALGGAFTAGGGDADVLAYNPAGLALQTENHASFMHQNHFQGVTREHIAVALRSGFGLSLDHLNFGDIQRTTLSNPAGTGLGEFQATAQSIAAGFGRQAGDRTAFGLAVKHVRETIDGTLGSAWVLDAGANYRAGDAPLWQLGVAVQNIGTKTKFESKREPLPLAVRWGSALQFDWLGRPVGVLTDLDQDPDGRFSPRIGIAVIAAPGLSLRVGYNGRNDAGIGVTAGFGIQWSGASIDYALVPFGNLGVSHQLSLGLRWGPAAMGRVLPDATGRF